MLPEDETLLRELFMNYSPKLVMQRLSTIALEAAGECSDNGFNDRAKELTQFAKALEDITVGRPFLV